jgi:hypothetical protein
VFLSLTVGSAYSEVAIGWLLALEIPGGLSLMVLFPLFLRFKKKVGEFPQSNLVICLASLALIMAGCALYAGLNLAVTIDARPNEDSFVISLLPFVGYALLFAGSVLAGIVAIRLRKLYLSAAYEELDEESPILEHHDMQVKPQYENAFYNVNQAAVPRLNLQPASPQMDLHSSQQLSPRLTVDYSPPVSPRSSYGAPPNYQQSSSLPNSPRDNLQPPSMDLHGSQGSYSPRMDLHGSQGSYSPRMDLRSSQGSYSPRMDLRSSQGSYSPAPPQSGSQPGSPVYSPRLYQSGNTLPPSYAETTEFAKEPPATEYLGVSPGYHSNSDGECHSPRPPRAEFEYDKPPPTDEMEL